MNVSVKKPTIAEQAQSAADSAKLAAEAANKAAAAAQAEADQRHGLAHGPSIAAWEWVEYAEQSAR